MAQPRRTTRAPRDLNGPRPIKAAITILGFVLVGGLGYVAGSLNGHSFSANQLLGGASLDLTKLQQTYRTLQENYDGDLDQAKLIEGANKGLVDAVGDQYTVYMNREESTEFDNSLTGNIGGGVGVEVGVRNDVNTVLRVLKDNPAEKAGAMVGDVIVKVNDEDVTGLKVAEVVAKIRGEAGTSVKVTVIRNGELKDLTMTREVVNNPSAFGEVRDGVGILTVSRFDDDTGDLARSVAREFKTAGVKGVVLDLRGNGGGYVTAAQDVAGIWLDDKVVVSERTGGRMTEELKSGRDPILNGIPLVVLVNESSASASEIVAGALRDNKAATLVGATTFGKGSVQKLINLMDGATLKVTVARWYTPAGVNISKTGIKPDQEVGRTAEDANAGRDPQLDAALSKAAQ